MLHGPQTSLNKIRQSMRLSLYSTHLDNPYINEAHQTPKPLLYKRRRSQSKKLLDLLARRNKNHYARHLTPRILGQDCRPPRLKAEPGTAVDYTALGGVIRTARNVPKPIDDGDLALQLVLVPWRRGRIGRWNVGHPTRPDTSFDVISSCPTLLCSDDFSDKIRSIPQTANLILHDIFQDTFLLEDHLSLLFVVAGALTVTPPPC